MMKKVLTMMILVLITLVGICGTVNADDLKTQLKVIQKASETKQLENKQGFLGSEIVSSDSENGVVNVSVSLENISEKLEAGKQKYENTEIFIIIPENTRKEEKDKRDYVNELSSKILEKNSKTKIGVIGIQGTILDISYDEDGNAKFGTNDQSRVNGTEDNAECVVELTNDLEVIKNKLQNMNSEGKKYYKNFQAAIRLAKKSFSQNVNKILISLYDDVPGISIGTSNNFRKEGNETATDASKRHLSELVKNTKAEILTLKDANIDFILLRPDDTAFDCEFVDMDTGEITAKIDGKPYADELYGTLEKPVYGKMYGLSDENIEKVITENIYNDVEQLLQKEIKNATVEIYFTNDIIENFDITVSEEDSSNVDTSKLLTDRLLTWNIGTLEGNKSSSLEYTLKIKNMKNTALLDKEIAINDNVKLSYVDYQENAKTANITSSPKIQLSEVKETITPDPDQDPGSNPTPGSDSDSGSDSGSKQPTTSSKQDGDSGSKQNSGQDTTIKTGSLPQTGVKVGILVLTAIIAIGGVYMYIRVRKLKDI